MLSLFGSVHRLSKRPVVWRLMAKDANKLTIGFEFNYLSFQNTFLFFGHKKVCIGQKNGIKMG
jgi:hypothetical protein